MMARLGDVGKVVTGNTPKTSDAKNYDSNDICFVKPSDIVEGIITHLNVSEYYISESARAKARILPPKSVLVTCIGIICKVAINDVECAFNQQINAIIPNESKCMTEYLAYAIQNKQVEMQDIANAPVVPILNKTQFSDIEINLPSLTEQAEIVGKLNTISRLIALREEQLAKLDELVKSRFIELFGDPELNPNNWETTTIGRVVQSCEAGWSGNGTQREKRPGEIAVLKVSAVTKGFFVPEECKVLNNQNEIKKYVFPQKGDLLFSRANTREMVGATAVIFQDYPELILPDKLWRIRFLPCANVLYMKHILSHRSIRSKFSEASTGTSGSMFNVSMEKFKAIEIPLPSIVPQNQFATFVEQTDKSKLAIQQSVERLETLKKALMQEYFG